MCRVSINSSSCPNSFSPALLSSSNAVLSKSIILHSIWKRSLHYPASITYLPFIMPFFSSKFQTVWLIMLFQVKCSLFGYYVIGLAAEDFFKWSPILAEWRQSQSEGNHQKMKLLRPPSSSWCLAVPLNAGTEILQQAQRLPLCSCPCDFYSGYKQRWRPHECPSAHSSIHSFVHGLMLSCNISSHLFCHLPSPAQSPYEEKKYVLDLMSGEWGESRKYVTIPEGLCQMD